MGFSMKNYKWIFINFFLLFVTNLFGQAKKPTLMVLPSDNWCVQRYFITEFDNQGTKMKVPNYKQAFQEDNEIGQVISKIGALLIDRGFPLKDAEQEIKNIELKSAEDAVISSASNSVSIAETPIDILKKRAKADIIIQIWWSLNKVENGRSVNFILEAFDTYTNKRIASSTGTSSMYVDKVIPQMLQETINEHIDPFVSQLQNYFTDMFTNGREVSIGIKKWQNWKQSLETEYEGKELSEIIEDWMQKNSFKNKYNISDQTETFIKFEQVRIPVTDSQNKAIDARMFLRELQKYLKGAPYNIDSKLVTRGLGEAFLILGEK